MSRIIEVVPYNADWPLMFADQAQLIQSALGNNCVDVHHVGSTSVPGLAAKPKIDIIAVVSNTLIITEALEQVGYTAKGEFNIPFHRGFTKRNFPLVNLHVFEEGNPEINLNILFRNYLRAHPEACREYAELKFNLVAQTHLHDKNGERFPGYTLGKDYFIKKILDLAGFDEICLKFCTHYDEWKAAEDFRHQHGLDEACRAEDHIHFILYKGTAIIGYANMQLGSNQIAKMHLIAIEKPHKNSGYEDHILKLSQRWLQQQGLKDLHYD